MKRRGWFYRDIPFKTKCAVYRAIVLSTLLYGADAWTIYKADAHRLHVYYMRHLRSILNVRWGQHVSNRTILKRTGLPGMHEMLVQRNLRWAGHLNRLGDDRLPKQILYSQLREGSRGIGRPKLRYNDKIKRNLKDLNIPIGSWQDATRDRLNWRKMIRVVSS